MNTSRPAHISPNTTAYTAVYIGQHVWWEESPGVWVEYKITGYASDGHLDVEVYPPVSVAGQPCGARFSRRDLHPRSSVTR